jgi:hypothetical protein
MSRARHYHIVRKAEPVTETASLVADALHDVADAIRTLAGVFAWGAVSDHSDTHGRQKEMAAVILRFASEGYFSTKVDGQKVCEADSELARQMLDRLFGPPKAKR